MAKPSGTDLRGPNNCYRTAGWGRGCDRDRPRGVTAYNLDVSSGSLSHTVGVVWPELRRQRKVARTSGSQVSSS